MNRTFIRPKIALLNLLFIEHGLVKLFRFPGAQPTSPGPLPPLLVVAALIELIGGGLHAIGLFTRIAAFICADQMAVAYFIAHAPRSFWPVVNGGDAAILFCFGFLYLSAAGGGVWSLDEHRRAKD